MTDISPDVPETKKPGRIGRVRWVAELNQALAEGLAKSQWLARVEIDQMGAGKQICRDLWPFIRLLPDNIKAVKDKLPESLEPAKLFLNNLADEERHYQELYLKQCELAGLSRQELLPSDSIPSAATATLLKTMHQACIEGDVYTGVQAIVAAELAATQFARAAEGTFERYFLQHQAQYGQQKIEDGLAWLRIHARPNTRHALWMNRMLVGLGQENDCPDLPFTVKEILHSIFGLWCVDEKVMKIWLIENQQESEYRCQAISN
ncbi:MAG: hypothetical protein JST01_06255 [Cyanobacteria bacterium SZAS TMP-1]|nr:hypothetical protein [Cyanobacteria bacterium SZAS TMP-1]